MFGNLNIFFNVYWRPVVSAGICMKGIAGVKIFLRCYDNYPVIVPMTAIFVQTMNVH